MTSFTMSLSSLWAVPHSASLLALHTTTESRSLLQVL